MISSIYNDSKLTNGIGEPKTRSNLMLAINRNEPFECLTRFLIVKNGYHHFIQGASSTGKAEA